MKNSFILLINLLLPTLLLAQPGFEVKEIQKKWVGDQMHNTYEVLILQAEKKDVLKAIEHKIEHGGEVKCEVNESAISANSVVMSAFWTDSVDIYTLSEADKLGTRVFFAFWMDTLCLGSASHHEYDVFIRKFIKDIALSEYINAVQEELKNEEKKLLLIEKEQAKFKKEEDKIRLEIKEEELDVVGMKDDLTINEKDRENKVNQIQDQKAAVEKVDPTDKVSASAEKDKLKTYKSDLKQLKKQYKKISKNIFKTESGITDLKEELAKSLKEKEGVDKRRSDQYDWIQSVKAKLLAAQNAL
ncbi:hypothetical protein KFE98_18660 [bacterium SCSIO 12741]|nr:hypothetical protein KFE98_18660 [bacterium SCSIO 12741]